MASDSNVEGGTTAVAQVETFLLNNDFDDAETSVTMTITAEDGSSTETVSITPTGVDESTIASAWKTDLDGSTKVLLAAITWTVSSATVTATAKVAGIPFYAASSVTGGLGTITDTITTANAGPADWNTAANHNPSGVPTSNQKIYVVPHPADDKTYPIKYGLDQNAVDLTELRYPDTHRASVGDSINGYYLRMDVSGTGTPLLILNGRGESYWHKGVLDTVYVLRASNSKDAIHLSGGAIVTLYITGPDVQGTVTIANSTNIANIYIIDAPGAIVKLGESLSNLNVLEMDSGAVLLESDMTGASSTIKVNGGILTIETAAWTTGSIIEVRKGGTVKFNVGGTLERFRLYGGEFNMDDNQSSGLTIDNSEQWSGLLSANSGLGNLTYTNVSTQHKQHGGVAIGDVPTTPIPS